MANPEPAAASRNAALLVFACIGIFLAVIGSLAAYFLWPRGERVGALDLRAAVSSLGVELAAGDTLNFRLDVTVGTTSGYPNSSRSRHNAVHDELEASAIILTLAQGGVPLASTQCGAYAGKATTVSSTSDEVESSGLPLDCSLKAQKSGKYALTSRVTWAPRDVRVAQLEVRRRRAGD